MLVYNLLFGTLAQSCSLSCSMTCSLTCSLPCSPSMLGSLQGLHILCGGGCRERADSRLLQGCGWVCSCGTNARALFLLQLTFILLPFSFPVQLPSSLSVLGGLWWAWSLLSSLASSLASLREFGSLSRSSSSCWSTWPTWRPSSSPYLPFCREYKSPYQSQYQSQSPY